MKRLVSGLWLLCVALPALAGPSVHHRLDVTLSAEPPTLEVRDTITLPEGDPSQAREVLFTLGAGLHIQPTGTRPAPRALAATDAGHARRYELHLPPGTRRRTLSYHGALPSTEGIYLSAAEPWYPLIDEHMVRFDMRVHAPAGWQVVSQGGRQEGAGTVTWREEHPQQEILLVAAPWTLYRRATPVAEAQVYLLAPDRDLAERYLSATGEYLGLFSRLLGPYPYAKFALVENRRQTGYGMPSFTLLGSRVIRLPFILHSSYPHEILHNWWGNGVYVDYAQGNWSEGLTAYLADHLIQERQGRGARYRRAALKKYADYVGHEKDFPLTEFRARHGEVSQAVGYSKALMVFHMLRRALGDRVFLTGLRRFYHNERFQRASYADLEHAFSQAAAESSNPPATARDLGDFFRQWIGRAGAPALALEGVRVAAAGGAYELRGHVLQTQSEPPYRLGVPLAIQLEGADEAELARVEMSGRREAFTLRFTRRPTALVVDPRYDLFRRLDRAESPPSLGRVLGAGEVVYVLPGEAPARLREAYRRLARAWSGKNAKVVVDREIASLPADAAVWLLGWRNRFLGELRRALSAQALSWSDGVPRVAGRDLLRDEYSVMLAADGRSGRGLGWIATDKLAALPGLIRKLPHYSRYSYLAFRGEAPDNVLKGQWEVLDSPLSVSLVPQTRPPRPRLPPERPLTALLEDPG